MASNDRTVLAQEKKIDQLQKTISNVRKTTREQLREGEEVVAVVVSAGGAGYLEGRYPDKMTAMGVPVVALVGGALTIAGVLGYVPDEPLITGAGLGLLAAGAHGFGVKKGQAASTG